MAIEQDETTPQLSLFRPLEDERLDDDGRPLGDEEDEESEVNRYEP